MLSVKLFVRHALTFVAATSIGWLATTWATPRVIMHIALERIEARAGGTNTIIKALQIDEHAREVVRPSPDLLYSLCAFDLSQGDVSVTVGSTPGYWSISFYDRATNNFDVRGFGSGSNAAKVFRISRRSAQGAVISPSDRGLALIRRRLGTGEDLKVALKAQDGDDCGLFAQG